LSCSHTICRGANENSSPLASADVFVKNNQQFLPRDVMVVMRALKVIVTLIAVVGFAGAVVLTAHLLAGPVM
jgi:hypothetical protein